MKRGASHTWRDDGSARHVIAGLSAPSFVIVAAALSLTLAALAARTMAPEAAPPRAQKTLAVQAPSAAPRAAHTQAAQTQPRRTPTP